MGRILHVGTRKTATTSLQTTLYNNRRPLAEQGLVYPNLVDRKLRQRDGHQMRARPLAENSPKGLASLARVSKNFPEALNEDGKLIPEVQNLSPHVFDVLISTFEDIL